MGIGVISLVTSQKKEPSGSPFTVGSAHNGTSIDTAGKVVLGNDVGDPLSPAELLNDREIITEDALFNLFAVVFNSFFTGIVTRLTGQTIEMIGAANTSPLLSLVTSGAVSGNQIEMRNSGGGSNTLQITNVNGNNAINSVTTNAKSSVILLRTDTGGLCQLRLQSQPDSLEIQSRGNGFITFQINNVQSVWRIETATGNTQIGPTLFGFNGAALQVSGSCTKRLLPQSSGSALVIVDRDTDSSKFYMNTAAVTLSIPNMLSSNFRPGFYIDVCCTDATGITIQADAGVTFLYGNLSTSAGGTISSTVVGSFLRLLIVDPVTYVVPFSMGVWTLT